MRRVEAWGGMEWQARPDEARRGTEWHGVARQAGRGQGMTRRGTA